MAVTLERTFDYVLIRNIMTHSGVWDGIGDDFTPPMDQWHPAESDSLWYVLAHDGARLLGLWLCVPHSPVLWEVHTCLLPTTTRAVGREAAKAMAAYLWENTTCVRIFTQVPEYNRAARMFAKAAGMQKYGENLMCYQKNGKLYNLLLLGISKKEVI